MQLLKLIQKQQKVYYQMNKKPLPADNFNMNITNDNRKRFILLLLN